MRALSLFSALTLTALAGCQCDDQLSDVPGGLHGEACAATTGEPIAGGFVHIRAAGSDVDVDDGVVGTDGSGAWTSKALAPGKYDVLVDDETAGSAPRLLQSGVEVTARARVTDPLPFVEDEACRGDPDLPDDGCVVGDICNRHVGTLVAGGDVLAKVGANTFTGTTDENGHFEICGIDEGLGTVTIQAPGFQRTFPIEIQLGTPFVIALDDNCNLQTTSTGCLIASICDPALGPNSNLVGAAVTVTPVGGGADEVTHDLTDDLGFFEVCGLAPGTYEVRVVGDGVDATENVVVEAGATSDVVGPAACESRVELGRVEGQVCDEVAGGIFSGRVELRDEGGNRVGNAVLSDDDGTFAFEAVPPGEYVVAFPDDPGLTPIPITVSAFQTTVLTARNCPLPDDVCTDFTHSPTTTSDGRIFFIVDKSGSMLQVAQGFGGGDKWSALKNAINGVTSTLTSDAIDYALVEYPDPRNTDCESDSSCVVACDVGTQQVAMGGSGAQVNGSLNSTTPFGGTPTAQTLANTKATIESLTAIERPLAVVLATDGAPNCGTTQGLQSGQADLRVNCTLTVGSVCTSTADGQTDTSCAPFNCLDLTAVDRVREIAGLGVDVHVIGIRGSNESSAAFTDTLNAMAVAGGAPLPAGSATRFHDGNNTQALEDALQAVTLRIVACNITTPFRVDNASSISLTIGTTPVLQNESRTNGWDVTGPNSIQLFGAACDRATDTAADIHIERCVEAGQE